MSLRGLRGTCLLSTIHLANGIGHINGIMEFFFRQILDGFKDLLIGTMLLSMFDEIFLLCRKIDPLFLIMLIKSGSIPFVAVIDY